MNRVRAKFGVVHIANTEYGYKIVRLDAIYKGDESSPENESFSTATPYGTIELHVTNPRAVEFFEKLGGLKYVYVDFTEAE